MRSDVKLDVTRAKSQVIVLFFLMCLRTHIMFIIYKMLQIHKCLFSQY